MTWRKLDYVVFPTLFLTYLAFVDLTPGTGTILIMLVLINHKITNLTCAMRDIVQVASDAVTAMHKQIEDPDD